MVEVRTDLRDSFIEKLIELARSDERIVVLDADVSTSTKSHAFAQAFPERFVELGIAEQSMVGTAAGLATMGLMPFVCCYAVFASSRAFDQVRISVAQTRLNVKIVGTHGGVSVGMDGPTHHSIEDICLMRTLPYVTVISPADDVETKAATEYITRLAGPCYMRLLRVKVPRIFDSGYEFKPGRGLVLSPGSDVTIMATGVMLAHALKAQDKLQAEGYSVRLINIHTIKPIDEDIIIESAKTTGGIVTCEDHSIYGGLGSAVAEVLVRHCPVKLRTVGVRDCFAESAPPHDLFEKYCLTADAIAHAAKELIQEKV
ncbi:transketolase [candidate division TA06 bacterium DG_26]|uniref:Transketolase n=1 Tax=candidate division TA06 bacterium DG_26 TaxID=1703771 RepID=A0A0S7WLS0_UNCT6|nr:MAG: transketolase [candidate division TA06 bacterium DG_26]